MASPAGYIGKAVVVILVCHALAIGASAANAQSAADLSLLELAGHHALHRAIEEEGEPLSAFTTDGCSGGLSSAWRVVAERYPDFSGAHGQIPPWQACCVVHDRAYHAGGREASPAEGAQARLLADETLKACVIETADGDRSQLADYYETTEEEIQSAYRSIGEAMFLAVRFGGGPCSGLPWRWGYGSPQCLIKPGDFPD